MKMLLRQDVEELDAGEEELCSKDELLLLAVREDDVGASPRLRAGA